MQETRVGEEVSSKPVQHHQYIDSGILLVSCFRHRIARSLEAGWSVSKDMGASMMGEGQALGAQCATLHGT